MQVDTPGSWLQKKKTRIKLMSRHKDSYETLTRVDSSVLDTEIPRYDQVHR